MKHEYHSSEYYAQAFRDFLHESVGWKDSERRINQAFPADCSAGGVLLKCRSYCFSLTFQPRGEDSLEIVLEEGVDGDFKKGASRRGETKINVHRTKKGKISRSSLVSLFDWLYPHFQRRD